MLFEGDSEFLGAANYVLAIHAAGECLVFQFFAHGRRFDIGDFLGGLHQCASGEETRQLVAGIQSVIERGFTGDSAVIGMAQDGTGTIAAPLRVSA